VIGDASSAIIGTAAANRQPSSGVEEQICAVVKHAGTDEVWLYDGVNNIRILEGTARADLIVATSGSVAHPMYNTSIMIDNAVYFRKTGTTDRCAISVVQTNV